MRFSSILATVLIAVLQAALAAHAANACSVGSSHVGHCGRAQGSASERPACCRGSETVPLVSRIQSAVERTGVVLATAHLPIENPAIVTRTIEPRRHDRPPFDRFSSLRLHLVLATLIV